MKNRWPLFWWQFRNILPVTILGALLVSLYVLATPKSHQQHLGFGQQFFLVMHSFLLVWPLGRPGSREAGFLYSQGFSRDSIWTTTLAASFSGVFATLIIPCLLLWSGIASSVRTQTSGGRWQPPSDFNEMLDPALWLIVYVFFVPLFQYAWIRAAQCSRDSATGILLALAAVFVMMSVGENGWSRDWPAGFLLCVFAVVVVSTVTILLMSRRLHRQMEV